jgi:alpha-ketoglutarate-dependent taurine dioxygenase
MRAPTSTPTIPYLDVPARCTMLYALQMPKAGNGTTFANQSRAYDDLSDSMKARLERAGCASPLRQPRRPR